MNQALEPAAEARFGKSRKGELGGRPMTARALDKLCYTIMALIAVMVFTDFGLLAYGLTIG